MLLFDLLRCGQAREEAFQQKRTTKSSFKRASDHHLPVFIDSSQTAHGWKLNVHARARASAPHGRRLTCYIKACRRVYSISHRLQPYLITLSEGDLRLLPCSPLYQGHSSRLTGSKCMGAAGSSQPFVPRLAAPPNVAPNLREQQAACGVFRNPQVPSMALLNHPSAMHSPANWVSSPGVRTSRPKAVSLGGCYRC